LKVVNGFGGLCFLPINPKNTSIFLKIRYLTFHEFKFGANFKFKFSRQLHVISRKFPRELADLYQEMGIKK